MSREVSATITECSVFTDMDTPSRENVANMFTNSLVGRITPCPPMVSLTDKPPERARQAAVPAVRAKPFCLLLVMITATSACDAMSRGAPHRGTPVVIDDTLLRYPDSSTLALGAGDLAFIGLLEAETARPFVIVAARGCDACEASDAVLVRAPAEGRVIDGDRRGEHPYPGRVLAGENATVRSYSRVFWGVCLPQRPPGVISFRSEFAWAGDEPLREVRITEIHGDSLLDWRTVPEVRALAATLQQVRTRRCSEVPSRDLTASP